MVQQFADGENFAPEPSRLSKYVLDYVGRIPTSSESTNAAPKQRAAAIVKSAALRAGAVAGTLALPPGPLGWLTIAPELMAIWRIQAQMVVDIAAVHGRPQAVTRERMVYCLFRHAAAQVVRDLGVQVGERIFVKAASTEFMQNMGRKVGVRVTERVVGKGLSRFIPIIGAIGVGAYAYYDTRQVAKVTLEYLERNEPALPAAASTTVN